MSATLKFAPPVISIDIEDWPQSSWDRSLPITERSAANTRRVLDILERAGVRATMFVLGKFAETFPKIVREIQAQGHEIACHSYGHLEIFKQSREQFRADLRRGKEILEQIVGERIRGYRAPDFSVVRDSLWALEDLAEAGFDYDSSIFPVKRPRYGIPDWPLSPARVRLPSGRSIVEFPLASYRALGKNWPVGGGGYHRLLPGFMSRWVAGRIMRSAPFVFYCHPYEFDARELVEIPLQIPLAIRLHQGLGRGRFESRFTAMLRSFGGRRMSDLLDQQTWPELEVQGFARAATVAHAAS